MKKLIPLFAFVFIVGTLPLLSGCGKPADPGAQGAAESAKPLGPDESILAMLNGVNNQQMEAVWNFLPASYQQDVNGIAHEFASKMDPEMYNGTFETGQRLAKLLKDKKEYILKNQMIQGLPVPPEKMDEFWDPTTNIISALVNSDLSSLDKLKSFDGGKFLSTTGNQLAKSVMALSSLVPQKEGEPSFSEKLKQTKVTVVKTEGDTATIKIEAPGEEPKEEEMVKVEGKWIPKNLADNWDTKMADVRKKLADLTPEQVTAQKEQTLAGIKQVNETLAKLENAKSEEEFNKTLSPILAPVAMLAPMMMMQLGQQPMMGGPGPGGPSLGENKPADPNQIVTIVIEKKLSNAEQDPIIEQILLSVDDSEQVNIVPMAEGETTIFKISPVTDVEAFAKKIKFGKPAKVDAKKRSITVELEK
ncbi:hypothetical protein [Gimesia sp.]|uniref:hypothetical protein n=1 Tax=Gimesia sp. TaxID=2024833 RepID=UPI0025C3D835|nr:hypothetical protein [Gimesia sp.]|tara:strand:- start:4354 stop:5607 length:1254 start_codon:yes stop_codon:yes gene_type:complete